MGRRFATRHATDCRGIGCTTQHLNMPSFSFTAPIITLAEEQIERDELDGPARQALHADVSGQPRAKRKSGESVKNTAAQASLEQIKAILEQYPPKEKSACLEALAEVPQLFHKESPLDVYMSHCDGRIEVRTTCDPMCGGRLAESYNV